METIQSRVDELLAEMTPAEKAGQLTQYFYFRLPDGCRAGSRTSTPTSSRRWSRRRCGRAAPARCCSSPTRPRSTACSGSRSRATASASRCCSASTSSTGCARSSRCRSRWPRPGIPRPSSAARPSPPARRAPSASTGPSRRWSTSPATRAGAGSSRAPARTRTSALPSPPPRCAASRAASSGAPERVIAGPKHFAGYGAALGGRDYDEVNLSDSELWNVYFPPFQAAVEAGAGNVMTAYMDLNGIPATGNRWLFTEVLRETWGFDGFVVSDANAVRNLRHPRLRRRPDRRRRPRASTPASTWRWRSPTRPTRTCPRRWSPGAASAEAVDASVRRVLEAKMRMGLFDDPYVDEDRAREVLADPAHREVARVAAERSAVLLRNEGDLLPLDAGSLSSIAVIGPLADSKRDTIGPWVFDFDLDETVTVLDGIRAKVGRRRPGRSRPRRPRRAARLPVDVRHVRRQQPDGSRGLRRGRRVPAGRRAGPRRRRRGRRRRRVAEHDRRERPRARRWSCPAASSSCCRPSSRPARRSCCW